MESLSRAVKRFLDWFRAQTDVRRAALLGIGFGLLLCIIIFISIVLVTYAGTLGK
jgi:hypothetical protein